MICYPRLFCPLCLSIKLHAFQCLDCLSIHRMMKLLSHIFHLTMMYVKVQPPMYYHFLCCLLVTPFFLHFLMFLEFWIFLCFCNVNTFSFSILPLKLKTRWILYFKTRKFIKIKNLEKIKKRHPDEFICKSLFENTRILYQAQQVMTWTQPFFIW